MKFELDTNRITFIRYMLMSGKTVEFTLEDGILIDLDTVVETDEKPVMNADNNEVATLKEMCSEVKNLKDELDGYENHTRENGNHSVRPSVLCETMGKQMKALKEWKEKIE